MAPHDKIIWLLALTLSLPMNAFAADGVLNSLFLEEPREAISARGVNFEAVYTGEMVSNTAGGLNQHTTYLGKLAMGLTLDLEQAKLIPGATAYVSALNTHGGEKPSVKYIGDFQVASNIEAPDAMSLFEAWYEQNLLGEKVSILAGLHDLNADFAVTESALTFINSSFGIGPDLSANVPTSIFPSVGPAIRVRLQPNKRFDFLAGIYDGDPTNGGKNRHGTGQRLSARQGLLTIFEACFHHNDIRFNSEMDPLPGSLKFGSWLHTQNRDDLFSLVDPDLDLNPDAQAAPTVHGNNYGFYGIAHHMLFHEKKETAEGLNFFLQYGGAPDDRNTLDYYLGGGLTYRGMLPKRNEDVAGAAFAMASFSERLRAARQRDIDTFDPSDPKAGPMPGALESQETALESTYRIQLHERFAVQPDYQIIFNPSAEDHRKTAHVLLLRFEITY